jgi:urease accessory protein
MSRIHTALATVTTVAALTVAAVTTLGAHEGHGHTHLTLMDGILHPLTGIDHLLALVALAVLCARTGGRGALGVLAFALAFAVGTQLPGLAGPGWEPLVWLGSAALLLSTCAAPRLPTMPLVVVLAGLAHGVPHGAELATSSAALIGAVAAVSLLPLAGLGWRRLFVDTSDSARAPAAT